jgi:hypothetical protein
VCNFFCEKVGRIIRLLLLTEASVFKDRFLLGVFILIIIIAALSQIKHPEIRVSQFVKFVLQKLLDFDRFANVKKIKDLPSNWLYFHFNE